MPIYEYKCNGCGKGLEVIQKFSDEPLKDCPECGGELVKMISCTSFVLKGAGWYADGYSSAKPKKDEAGAATSSPAKTAPSGDGGPSASGPGEKKPASNTPADTK